MRRAGIDPWRERERGESLSVCGQSFVPAPGNPLFLVTPPLKDRNQVPLKVMANADGFEQLPLTRQWRGKVPLGRGFSQMDWMRLASRSDSLTPHRSAAPIPMDEVRRHATPDDAWCVLRGVVYDITPYLHYHPGGFESIASVAGTDATRVFEFYHKWVNYHAMLEKCAIGILAA